MTNPSEVVEQEILNTMRPPSVEQEEDAWRVKGINFESVLKNRADAPEPFSYIADGRRIGFACDMIGWSNGETIQDGADASEIVQIKADGTQMIHTYPGAFGQGIDIKIVQDNYRWQKIVEIESLESLGAIPADVEYLEISFTISGDVNVPDGGIDTPVLFGEDNFIQPIRVWDSTGDAVEGVATGAVEGDALTKQVSVGWLKSAVYPVEADLTIMFGSENARHRDHDAQFDGDVGFYPLGGRIGDAT